MRRPCPSPRSTARESDQGRMRDEAHDCWLRSRTRQPEQDTSSTMKGRHLTNSASLRRKASLDGASGGSVP